MGGFCSCFHVPDEEDTAGSHDTTSDTCFCPSCLIQKFKNKHVNHFMQRQRKEITSPNGEASSSSNPAGLVQNNAAAGSSSCVESSGSSRGRHGLRMLISPNQVMRAEEQMPRSSAVDVEEEECPTCLEEYTPENPKKVAKCSHHYHLSCIYEWMERSAYCPMCAKLMIFDE